MDLAEPVPDGRTTRRLADIAARRGMTIVAGWRNAAAHAAFNSAVVVGPRGDRLLSENISSLKPPILYSVTAGFECGTLWIPAKVGS